jgi:hypothetical protein
MAIAKKACPFQNLQNAKLALGLSPCSQTLGSLLRTPLAGEPVGKMDLMKGRGYFGHMAFQHLRTAKIYS